MSLRVASSAAHRRVTVKIPPTATLVPGFADPAVAADGAQTNSNNLD